MGRSSRQPRVLLAEDDPEVGEALERILGFEGYFVMRVSDGAAALEAAASGQADVIVLDTDLPFVDGIAVCRRLRNHGHRTPVLMLGARLETEDLVTALDAGADDCLGTPFEMEELLARLRSLLRRTAPDLESMLEAGPLRLDPPSRSVTVDGSEIDLTPREFSLLELMLREAGVVLTKTVLYDRVWGYDLGSGSRSLDVHIGNLRRKLEASGSGRLIQTVRGVGYVLRAPRSTDARSH